VLLISIGVKIFLYGYNTKRSREKNSQALKAAAADCISDAVSTSVVTVSLLMDTLFHIRLDVWCGLLVALFIIYNGLKSFADTAHRIMGGNSDPEQTEKLRQYVLAFQDGVFVDVPEFQLHDYGYDRYGASLCVTAKREMDALSVAEYAAALKSAIYKDFGFTPIIQAELPAEEAECVRVQHTIRMAMQRLPFKAKAAQIRVNRAKERTQVILLAELPFESGKKEAEVTSTLQSLLPANEYDLLVKLRLGNSEWMDDEKHDRGRKRETKALKEKATLFNTIYPFLQDDLLERFGMNDGETVFVRIEARYAELLREADAYQTDGVRVHLCRKLFPLMACYQTLLENGVAQEAALCFARDESQKAAERKKLDS
jgi:hypothetical protein